MPPVYSDIVDPEEEGALLNMLPDDNPFAQLRAMAEKESGKRRTPAWRTAKCKE
jgi:hypothetical protein